MDQPALSETPASPSPRTRGDIEARYKWNLAHIFPDWEAWQAAYSELDRQIDAFGALRGSLVSGGEALLRALKLRDEIGQLEYKVWYFAALRYDEDQRDNASNGKQAP